MHADLNQEEESVFFIPKEEFDSVKQAYYSSGFAELFVVREYNINRGKNVLQRAWKVESTKLSKIKKYIFHVFFTSEDNLKIVIKRDP